MENITPVELNGIVVEEKMINHWPEIFSGCWINIYPKDPDAWDLSAELINDSTYPEGSIIKSDYKYFPDCLAIISWQKNGYGKYIWVKDEYRNQTIGYNLGLWLRTYLAKDGIQAIHPFIRERSDIVDWLFKKFKINYNAQDVPLRSDIVDGVPDA
jgi:hypothetical protein